MRYEVFLLALLCAVFTSSLGLPPRPQQCPAFVSKWTGIFLSNEIPFLDQKLLDIAIELNQGEVLCSAA